LCKKRRGAAGEEEASAQVEQGSGDLLFLVVFSRVFSIIRGEEQIFVSAQRAEEGEIQNFQVIAGLYFGFIIANYV
jgi:hypothetical protein